MNKYIENWNNTNLGSLLKNKKEKGHYGEELLSVTNEKGIVRRDSLERKDTSNNDKSKYLLVDKGDIAYNTMRMWQGVSGVSSLRGIVSPAYTVCYPTEKIDSKFAGYLLKDPAMISLFRERSQGLVSDTWNLKYEKFSQIPCSVPPLAEQKKIAQILTSIEELLFLLNKKKIKLINLKLGLFNELIINNKNAIFKKISDICSSSSGGTPDRSKLKYYEGNIPWVKSGEIKGSDIFQTEERITNEAIKNSSAKMIKSGSVLIAMYGATAGQSALLKVNAASNQAVLALSVNSNCLDNTYLFHALSASKNNLLLSCQGSGQPNLSSTLINNFSIPVPKLSTQNQINRTLKSLAINIDNLTLKIKRIKQLKKSISSDLLTGSKRVSV